MAEPSIYILPNDFIRLDRALISSKAWLGLSGTAVKVYLLFWSKARVVKSRNKPGRGGGYYIENNGQLQLTYKEVREAYGIYPARFKRALAELVSKGLLEVTRTGAGRFKRSSEYAISWRWREWGKPGFKQVGMKENPPPAGFNKRKQANPVKAKPEEQKKKPEPLTHKGNGRKKDKGQWITLGHAINRIDKIDCKTAREVSRWHLDNLLEHHGIETKIENRELLVRVDTLPVSLTNTTDGI